MGVTVLHPYSLPEGKTGQQAMEHLTKRLLALGAVHSGQFIVDCESYILPQASKSVHVLHNSEYPASTFSILDNGTKQIPLVADHLFDLLWMKITSSHFSKKQTIVESKGARFVYGDFLVKLGNVTMMENFKGILIEVEYRPCLIPCTCWEIIKELLQGLLGQTIPINIPSYFTHAVSGNIGMMNVHPNQNVIQKQNEIYQPIDTICQYLEQFSNFRKQTSLSNIHTGQSTLRI